MYFWTECYFLCEGECINELESFYAWRRMYLWALLFFVRSTSYLWTSYHFLHDTMYFCFMFFVWSRMYLCSECNYLHDTECIFELCNFCMKQNIFMSFVSFLHLTDIISPYNINWLLFVMEIGLFSKTPSAFLNIIKPISNLQKIRPIYILHCINLNDILLEAQIIKLIMLFCSRFVILFLYLKFFFRSFLIGGSVAAWKCYYVIPVAELIATFVIARGIRGSVRGCMTLTYRALSTNDVNRLKCFVYQMLFVWKYSSCSLTSLFFS
jgi:hypothetical protein